MDQKTLKYYIQCAEFLDSYNPSDFLKLMEENDISIEDASWAIGRFALSSDRVFARIEGKEIDELFNVPSEDTINKTREPDDVCFIICTLDEIEYSRTLEWINNLYIPSNITISALQVTEFDNLASGYNEAMNASNAKYKVYIREGVRIINPYFLFNVIDKFEKCPDVAMIGLLGSKYIPTNGIMEDVDCYGLMAVSGENETFICGESCDSDIDVSFIHSALVATNKDIPWNEEIQCNDEFTCSIHAMELKHQGYRVLTASQEYPWIIYDYGHDSFLHDDTNEVLLDKVVFDPEKKHILLCLGINSLIEMPNGGIDKLTSNFEIFDENKEKIQLFICMFPEDTVQWQNIDNSSYKKIESMLLQRNVLTGPINIELLNKFDAYYGDPSPLVLKMSDLKKPVMIRSADSEE